MQAASEQPAVTDKKENLITVYVTTPMCVKSYIKQHDLSAF